jgi:hypothetical protein
MKSHAKLSPLRVQANPIARVVDIALSATDLSP